MSSRLCPESLEIVKGTMFLRFPPVFANQNRCLPSRTEPGVVNPAGIGSRATTYGPDSCL